MSCVLETDCFSLSPAREFLSESESFRFSAERASSGKKKSTGVSVSTATERRAHVMCARALCSQLRCEICLGNNCYSLFTSSLHQRTFVSRLPVYGR